MLRAKNIKGNHVYKQHFKCCQYICVCKASYTCFSFEFGSTPCLKNTVQNCFCQNFVKFTPILIIFGRKMAKKLKLCEVHSFSTSTNLRHHSKTHNKLKHGLFSRIISSYNSSVQHCQNYARSMPNVHGHKHLDDNATENVKLYLRLKREYVTVQGLKGLKCAVVCYFQCRICNPSNLLNHVAFYRIDDANVSNLILTRKRGNCAALQLEASRSAACPPPSGVP